MGRLSKIAKYLNRHVVGNVFARDSICRAYSSDRSVLYAKPRLVALPETTDDLRKIVQFSNQLAIRKYELPVTIRGTALDKTGAAIGDGIVVSTERMNHIEEIDVRGRLVRVQPGVTLGELNTALGLHGLCLPVDYNPRATIGGLIANCPTDDGAHIHGGIFHYVERAEVVLSNGDVVQLAPYNLRIISLKMEQDSFEGLLYRKMHQLLDQHADTILNREMRPFDAGGYANITRVKKPHTVNLLPLMFASQGTLGLISDIILRIEVLPPVTQRLAVLIQDTAAMLRFLETVRGLEPATVKLYDLRIMKSVASEGNYPDLLPPDIDKGWLIIISFNYHRHKATKRINACLNHLPTGSIGIIEGAENANSFRELTSALTSFLNDVPQGERNPIADDVFIPSYKFQEYLDGLRLIEETMGLALPVFGSYLTANYQVRPDIDCSSIEGRKQVISFLRQYGHLVLDCDGSLTGGSPEGRMKALLTVPSLSPSERELYQDIKTAFDPNNILNPNVKLGSDIRDVIRHLRTEERDGIVTP